MDGVSRSGARAGFTLVELMVVAMLGALVVVGAYSAIVSQSGLFRTQSEITEARTTVRAATALLSSALMEVAANDGDVAAVSSSSFTIRQYLVTGTVCSKVVTAALETRFGLQELRGNLGALTSTDSLLAYDIVTDDWSVARVDAFWTGPNAWTAAPSGGGTPVCFWGDSTTAAPRPQATIRLDAVSTLLATVSVGAPIRIFRSTEYGVFQRDGAWWLGRRVSGASTWELLTGPLVPPALGGVDFTYYKSDGTTTTTGSEVAAVELFLWSRGGQVELSPGQPDPPAQDSVRLRVHVRNNVGV